MDGKDPDALPIPSDPSGPCPRCGRIAHFETEGRGHPLVWRADRLAGSFPVESASILKCSGCSGGLVVITNNQGEGTHWYPAPGAGVLDPAVPDRLASAYDEGQRCLSIGANRAAAVMFRAALSLYVKDKGSERAKAGRHLKVALKHMKNDNHLHHSLSEWADHLNQLGNEGAHPEDHDDVTSEEAKELAAFVRHLIRHEYEMPAALRRARGLPVQTPEE